MSKIHSARTNCYWMGRYIALSDHARNAALPLASNPDPPNPKSTPGTPTTSRSTPRHPSTAKVLCRSDHHHQMHDASRRDKAVFAHLRELCTTGEARESLAVFQGLLAEVLGETGKRGAGEKGEEESVRWCGEKKGWLEGLMGKRRGSGLGGSSNIDTKVYLS